MIYAEKTNLNIEAEKKLAKDFREEWVETAAVGDRSRLLRQQPFRRVHTGFSASDTFGYGGPIFDSNKMINRLVENMEAVQATGYNYALVRFGQLIDAGGVGYARTVSEQNPRTMDENTKMVSASLAKPICAVAIMKLIEDGVLTLTEKAYPYIQSSFPDVHDSVKNITIYQLLTHTSGLSGSSTLSGFADVLRNPANPTTISSYHNANYWFLAFVIEGATGNGYIDFARSQILQPMTITDMTNQVEDSPCLYYELGEFSDGVSWDDFDTTAIGAYGWYASAIHWAKFLAYFRYDKVLSSSTRYQMLSDSNIYFGFRRWFGQERGTYYGHGGDFHNGSKGFRGGMMGFPDYVDAVLLVNNRGSFDPGDILMDAYHAAYS
ncbi:MAG: serine hydrolase [Synechococcales cyanobacterium M58_A2018_015]|nr:serine hydrolase [Synechococcales cyanobacterium M58_A2018_015]